LDFEQQRLGPISDWSCFRRLTAISPNAHHKSYFMWDLEVVKTKPGSGVARNKKATVVAIFTKVFRHAGLRF
jgi:hypothetical protein